MVWTAVPSGGEEGQAKEVTQPSADASASIAGASVDGKVGASMDGRVAFGQTVEDVRFSGYCGLLSSQCQ